MTKEIVTPIDPQEDADHEMEWELRTREAVEKCLSEIEVVTPHTINMPHAPSCQCVQCTKGSGGSYDFTSVEEMISELIDIAGTEWSSYVPFEGGVAVFEFDPGRWDEEIRTMVEAADLHEWNPWHSYRNGPTAQIHKNILYQSRSAAARVVTQKGTVRPQNQKLLIYIMHDGDHPFLVMRRTEQNVKGKYVTREEFLKVGLCWPNPFVSDREDLALRLGRAILDEAGV